MTEQHELIQNFFNAIQALKDANIIRSDRYLGDIGEYLAAEKYNVTLSENQREEIIDGHIEGRSVQIKYNGSPTKTNIDVGRADQYDFLILIMARRSLHFPDDCSAEMISYQIESEEILESFSLSNKGTRCCTKSILEPFTYDIIEIG